MAENDKTDIEEKNSGLLCIQDGQKDGKKKSEMFQETLVECINGVAYFGDCQIKIEQLMKSFSECQLFTALSKL